MTGIERAAAWVFVTAARETTYGNYVIGLNELAKRFGELDAEELADEVYKVGDPWVLEVDVYDGTIDVTLSDYYTEECCLEYEDGGHFEEYDEGYSREEYEAAWRRVAEIGRGIDAA